MVPVLLGRCNVFEIREVKSWVVLAVAAGGSEEVKLSHASGRWATELNTLHIAGLRPTFLCNLVLSSTNPSLLFPSKPPPSTLQLHPHK